MPKKDYTILEKISKTIYNSYGKPIPLTVAEEVIMKRYLGGYAAWMDKPELTDNEICSLLMTNFSIKKSQALLDVAAIKFILGNIRNAGKEWYRHTVIEMLKKAYAKAEIDKNWLAMIQAADKLGKYTKCDQPDDEQLPWNEIIPPEFEPSNDIRNLSENLYDENIEEKRRLLRAKYSGATTVNFEEIKGDG